MSSLSANPTKISVTEVTTALTCPRLFWFGRVEARSTLLGGALGAGVGSRVHQLLRRFEEVCPSTSELQIAYGATPERDRLAGIERELLEILYHRFLVPEIRDDRDRGEADGSLYLGMWRALRGYAKAVAPLLADNGSVLPPAEVLGRTFLANELPLETAVSGFSQPVVLKGRADAVWFNHLRERVVVVDFKTRPLARGGEDLLQVAIYAHLLHIDHGVRAQGLLLSLANARTFRQYGPGELDRAWRGLLDSHLGDLVCWSRFSPVEAATLPGPAHARICGHCPLKAECYRRLEAPTTWTSIAGSPAPSTKRSSKKAPRTKRREEASTREREKARPQAVRPQPPACQKKSPRPSPAPAMSAGPARPDDPVGPRIRFGHERGGTTPIDWYPGDTRRVLHPNTAILGTMGTGKTQLTKSLVKQLRDAPGNLGGQPPHVLIFDYNGDYKTDDFVAATGAEVLTPFQLPFNPLALVGTRAHNLPSTVAGRFTDSMARSVDLGVVQRNRLKESVLSSYEARGIRNDDPDTWRLSPPTVADMVQTFLSEDPKQDSLYAILTDLERERLFEPDSSRAGSVWERLRGVTVIDLTQVSESMAALVVSTLLDLFYAEMITLGTSRQKGPQREIRCFVLVDEADNFLRGDFPSLRRLLKEARKFGVGVILSTQFLRHFKTRKERYYESFLTWILHRIDSVENREIRDIFGVHARGEIAELRDGIRSCGLHQSLVLMQREPGAGRERVPMDDLPFWRLLQEVPERVSLEPSISQDRHSPDRYTAEEHRGAPTEAGDPLVRSLPPETREMFLDLLGEAPVSAAALGEEVETYLAEIRAAAGSGELVDVESGEQLAVASRALLAHLTSDNSPTTHQLVQAAVRYFVLEDDAEGDLNSIVGFDDDVAVMNAVARHLGRSDLLIEQ